MNNNIIKQARLLMRRSGSNDPFRIARDTGIDVRFCDLGSLKGMYACIKRNRFIVINNNINERLQKIVCAHELGHDRFHRDLATNKWLHEFMIYNMSQRPEYEANLFASEILLPDDEVIELIKNGLDADQTARELNSDVNLVALKLATLSYQGYSFARLDSRDNFLK
jgi:Zn-dependent peptidase ImmA (M78 family)